MQAGTYKIAWDTPHPDGGNLIVFAHGEGRGSAWHVMNDIPGTGLTNTPNYIVFVCHDGSFEITDAVFNFAVLA